MAWIDNGPVALPTKPLVIFVGVILFAVAVGGAGLGVHAVWRPAGAASAGSGDEGLDAQAIAARPIVELPPPPQAAPVAAAPATNAAVVKKNDEDDSNAIAAKTAAAQAVQANPAKKASDIDDILTSSSEKPQPPAKPSTDESAPGVPAKSDVPF
jgi:hypothetical protein